MNILSASVSTGRDRVAISKCVFELADPSDLDHLLNQVRRLDNVYDVYRVKKRLVDRVLSGLEKGLT